MKLRSGRIINTIGDYENKKRHHPMDCKRTTIRFIACLFVFMLMNLFIYYYYSGGRNEF